LFHGVTAIDLLESTVRRKLPRRIFTGRFWENATMRILAGLLVLAAGLPLVHCSGSSGEAVAPQVISAETFEQRRLDMVREQIEGRGVKDAKVLEAMRQVPRHEFVPDTVRAEAYDDHPLPIGDGQTISQPYIVALMSELLKLEPGHRVLEVGTGSGYQAAVLSLLAGEVYSIEIVESLADEARSRFGQLGYKVNVRTGNGYEGWPEEAPFDRIILTAAPPELPQAVVEQLKPGGRLVAPVGPDGGVQELVVLDKDAEGQVNSMSVIGVRFVPMVDRPGP
jgi:protein-L-isoaspartate(D-aspartate) O-methyltransferase